MHQLAFVGLTDAFNASVCLFHHMHGGVPEEYMFTTHSRSGADLLKKGKPLISGEPRLPKDYWMKLDEGLDPFDAAIFSSAKEVFSANLIKYGLFKPNYRKMKYVCKDAHRLPPGRQCRFQL